MQPREIQVTHDRHRILEGEVLLFESEIVAHVLILVFVCSSWPLGPEKMYISLLASQRDETVTRASKAPSPHHCSSTQIYAMKPGNYEASKPIRLKSIVYF